MSDGDLKYEQPPPMSRSEREETFRSGDAESIGNALIGALYDDEEGSWIFDWCLKLIGHRDGVVRYSVALVLGNVAILRGGGIDLLKCLEAVETLINDLDERVRIAAKDAQEDVLHAIRLKGVS